MAVVSAGLVGNAIENEGVRERYGVYSYPRTRGNNYASIAADRVVARAAHARLLYGALLAPRARVSSG